MVFTVAQTQDKAVAFRDDIRRRAAAVGRHPDSVEISLGVVVLVAATEQEARRRERELYDTLPIEQSAQGLAAALGLDPAHIRPDDVIRLEDLPDRPAENSSEGFWARARCSPREGSPCASWSTAPPAGPATGCSSAPRSR
ncbi:LLM class flavin-dependent oxidoreductase [Actinacidiphila oryziradicis]|uniref:LLM class flavin-dependent oxidoreductase n=1 Tax=Actinacidiphila oryziradicis TaxID=2571141 RepID=UPI001B8049A5|nr:LLM class flavin-dependent oxidoreductase [Actinacidiphila oryziradicis]